MKIENKSINGITIKKTVFSNSLDKTKEFVEKDLSSLSLVLNTKNKSEKYEENKELSDL
jgi:hypothetical protein